MHAGHPGEVVWRLPDAEVLQQWETAPGQYCASALPGADSPLRSVPAREGKEGDHRRPDVEGCVGKLMVLQDAWCAFAQLSLLRNA